MARQAQHLYEFERFRLDRAKRLLLRDGRPVQLTPKCFDILLALVETGGDVVSKDELMKRIWPDTIVEEGNLTYNISMLRKALGERAGEHQYIVTVPGRGYQFVAAVSATYRTSKEQAAQEMSAPSEPDEHEAEQPGAPAPGRASERRNQRVTQINAVEDTPARIEPHKLVSSAVALILITLISVGGYLLGRSEQIPINTMAHKPISTLAVLPLINGSGDSTMEYLSDGISELLINSLSRLTGLKIIARSSSFKYKGKEIDPQEVARALGIEAILTGRIVERGGSLLISVELVDARDRTQV